MLKRFPKMSAFSRMIAASGALLAAAPSCESPDHSIDKETLDDCTDSREELQAAFNLTIEEQAAEADIPVLLAYASALAAIREGGLTISDDCRLQLWRLEAPQSQMTTYFQ